MRICNNDEEHIIEIDEFSGEYATGTAGLSFAAVGSTAYRVSRGTATGAIFIPAYRLNNGTYLPVTQISNGSDSNTSSAFGAAMTGTNTTLTSVTFAEDSLLTTIADNAFTNSPNLVSITIPASVTSIGNTVFRGCSGLTGSITIPEGVKTIGTALFNGCKNLTSITMPEDAALTGTGIFYDCQKLESITIPANTTNIGSATFYSCYGLTSITIPEGVKTIGNQAFEYCINLASVTLPEGLISIGQNAFKDCSKLESITIPASVTSLLGFSGSGLTSITFKGNNVAALTSINAASAMPYGNNFRTVYSAASPKAGTYTLNRETGTWAKTSEL
jgi:hypothetical protein